MLDPAATLAGEPMGVGLATVGQLKPACVLSPCAVGPGPIFAEKPPAARASPDGSINSVGDILGVAGQFGHDCS